MKRRAFLVAAVVLGALALPGRADAYVDPGTGSMILQTVIAVLAVGAAAVAAFWQRIKAFVSRLRDRRN